MTTFVSTLKARVLCAARNARVRQIAGSTLLIVVLVLIAFAIHDLARDVSYVDVVKAVSRVTWHDLALALLFTAASFFALSFYDVSGLQFAGHRLPFGQVLLTSFCAYAVGNTAGFGPLSGGAVRYRFYTPLGLGPEEIAKVIGFITAGFGLGVAMTGALGAIFAAGVVTHEIPIPPTPMRLLGILILVLVFIPVVLALRHERSMRLWGLSVPLPSAGLLLQQLCIAFVEIVLSGAVLWVLLPPHSVDFVPFIAVYSIAIGLAVLSHIPAGLGVFETIIVTALIGKVPVDRVLAALVLFRIVYYALPLGLAAILIVSLETRRAAAGLAASSLVASVGRLVPSVVAALTFLTGSMLVLSGLTPTAPGYLGVLAAYIPLFLVEGAHFLSSILGMVLIVSSRGLLFRMDGAWWVATVAAGLALLFAPLKALAWTETLVLCLLLGTLLFSRSEFGRRSSLLHDSLSWRWSLAVATILIGCGAVMLFAYREIPYSSDLWWQFEFQAPAPRSLRAALGIALATMLFSIWTLTRPWSGPSIRPSPEEIARAVAIVEAQPNPDANLVRMGDKSLLFSDDGTAFIMFARQGRSWIALFDPVGPKEAWPGLVWTFVELARLHGGRAVFYEVGPTGLSLYADAGLTAFRLGEFARVNLPTFSLEGKKRAPLRTALRKGERLGLSVTVVPPDELDGVLDEVRDVSNAWLAHHKVREKGFSLGAAEPDYVGTQPVALVRQEGRVIAFATVLATQAGEQVSIDLMRVRPDAPNGTMDYLFLALMQRYQAEGVTWFGLGMAPLSGFPASAATSIWNRVGRAVYDHGERFYHFKGLRGFKDKFGPEWEPRYMVVAGGINPLIALADVTVLIGGGVRGVVSK